MWVDNKVQEWEWKDLQLHSFNSFMLFGFEMVHSYNNIIEMFVSFINARSWLGCFCVYLEFLSDFMFSRVKIVIPTIIKLK